MEKAKLLKTLCAYYRVELCDEEKFLYWNFIQKLDDKNIGTVLIEIVEKFKYFPKISELNDLISQKADNKDVAMEWIGDIAQATRQFGKYNWEEAKAYLGEDKWAACTCMGGFRVLCDCNFDDASFRAQLRDACKAILNKNEIEKNNEKFIGKQLSHDRDLFLDIH